MKRFLALLLVLTMLYSMAIVFAGCEYSGIRESISSLWHEVGKDWYEAEDTEEDEGIDNKNGEDEENNNPFASFDTAPQKTPPTLLNSTCYSNDRAWIEYKDEHTNYLASIDKSGYEIFRMEYDDISSYDNFDEEYAYLHMTNGNLVLINKDGIVLYSVSETEDNKILAYGGGYVLCERYEEGFDYSRNLYEVYDKNGDIHRIYIGGNYGDASYCGNGVFGISLRGSWDWTATFYNAETRQWIVSAEDQVVGDINVRFDNGVACFGICYYDPDEVGYRSALRFITTNSGWGEKPLYMGWNYNDYGAGYHDGAVVLKELGGDIFCYNFESGEYAQLAETYASKALEGEFSDRSGFYSKATGFKNNRFILEMRGTDTKAYFGIFDKQWNAVIEPTTYDRIVGFDGFRLVLVKDGEIVVYDENGNRLFGADELNVDTISAYSDGAAMVGVGMYIDINGNYLFEEILFLQ